VQLRSENGAERMRDSLNSLISRSSYLCLLARLFLLHPLELSIGVPRLGLPFRSPQVHGERIWLGFARICLFRDGLQARSRPGWVTTVLLPNQK
jgi:hypothetical protein